MIRPFNDGDKSLTIEEVQAAYGKGFRPFGVKQLSNMSVLKSNGFVNVAPYHDDDGKLVRESVKKCMFSIENLAWKDVQLRKMVNRNIGGEDVELGSVLSEGQIGPNGGRIMWFPPYNIKFSENINTQ